MIEVQFTSDEVKNIALPYNNDMEFGEIIWGFRKDVWDWFETVESSTDIINATPRIRAGKNNQPIIKFKSEEIYLLFKLKWL